MGPVFSPYRGLHHCKALDQMNPREHFVRYPILYGGELPLAGDNATAVASIPRWDGERYRLERSERVRIRAALSKLRARRYFTRTHGPWDFPY